MSGIGFQGEVGTYGDNEGWCVAGGDEIEEFLCPFVLAMGGEEPAASCAADTGEREAPGYPGIAPG